MNENPNLEGQGVVILSKIFVVFVFSVAKCRPRCNPVGWKTE
jgi:hypothetical protein